MKNLTIILLLFISGTIFSQEITFTSPGFEIAENIDGDWKIILADNNLESFITISDSNMSFKNKNDGIVIYNLITIKVKQDDTMMQFSGNLNSKTGKEVLVLFANNAFHLLNGNKVYTYKNIQ